SLLDSALFPYTTLFRSGSGAGQHPSQSLLDIMTIYEEFGDFRDLDIAIIGDIMYSRVAVSNMMMLNQLGANVIFAGPNQYFDKRSEEHTSELQSRFDLV